MSENIIFALIYHPQKLLGLIHSKVRENQSGGSNEKMGRHAEKHIHID
jgi:hypothetical protein